MFGGAWKLEFKREKGRARSRSGTCRKKKPKNDNRDITKMAFLCTAGLSRVRTSTHHRLTQIDATVKQLYDPREEKKENTTQNVKTLVLMTIVIYTSEIRKGCPKLVRENPALEQSSSEAGWAHLVYGPRERGYVAIDMHVFITW